MKVYFDVLHLYYLPQYLPVLSAVETRQGEAVFVFYKQQDPQLMQAMHRAIEQYQLNVYWLESQEQTLDFYQNSDADWVIFGKAFEHIEQLNSHKKTALMQHGIGPKACYYDASNNAATVRFVEGQHRLARLQAMYPESRFVDTGYAKLDPLLSEQHKVTTSLCQLGLDESKPTLLYAPTFYPSSIECLGKRWVEQFSHCNIIIKPHFFSQTKKKYKRQQALLAHWQSYDHVHVASVEEFNLIEFMAISDVLLSDASSAIFEFFALKKPVVWCNFYKLRWSYRGPFAFRFKERMDSDLEYFKSLCFEATSSKGLAQQVHHALDAPLSRHSNANLQLIEKLAGQLDGCSAQRIVDTLYEN